MVPYANARDALSRKFLDKRDRAQMKHSCIRLVLVLLAHFVLSPSSARADTPNDQETIGFVVEAGGAWLLHTSTGQPLPVQVGQVLPANSRLIPSSSSDFIVIALLNGTSCRIPQASSAPELDPCPPIFPSFRREEKGMVDRILSALNKLIDSPKHTYFSALSRSGENRFFDSISLLSSDGSADLTPVVERVLEEESRLLLQEAIIARDTPSIRWSSSKQATLRITENAASIQNAEQGLYRVLELGPDGEPEPGEGWVLVLPAAIYSIEKELFARFSILLRGWSKGLDKRFVRGLARSYLTDLQDRAGLNNDYKEPDNVVRVRRLSASALREGQEQR